MTSKEIEKDTTTCNSRAQNWPYWHRFCERKCDSYAQAKRKEVCVVHLMLQFDLTLGF